MKIEEKINTRLTQLGYVPQTAAIAFDIFLKSLKPEETILYFLEGSIKNTIGFIVTTDQRVYYVGIGRHGDPFIESLKYSEITGITVREETLLPSSEITVHTTSKFNDIKVKGCDAHNAAEYKELIDLLTNRPKD
ncbi:MAG: PH domain-containing protein [Cytophaga sp.]|uniref:PH domain-containing protein n=1 Tax=Cytophaga sp. TaxID=29535 RepID=UPI003F813B9A